MMNSSAAFEHPRALSGQAGEEGGDAEGHPEVLAGALERAAGLGHGLVYLDGAGGAREESYRQLLEQAARVLTGLRAEALAPGQPVIFQFEHNRDFLTAFWACLLGGFVPVPLSLPPTYEQPHNVLAKLRNVWDMLGRPLVLSSPALTPRLRGFATRESLEGFRVTDLAALRTQPPATRWHASQPDDLTLLLLTSGSTGLPKAVRHTHRTLLRWAASVARACNFSSREVSLNWMPLDHVGGLVMFHLRDVVLGCRQIHAPTEPVLQRPLAWLDWIDRYRVTVTWAPNFAFGLVNEQADEIARGRWDLSSLHFILNGGEAIVSRTARRFLSLLQPHGLPPTAMRPAWGMSETSSSVTFSHRFTFASTRDDDPFVEVGEPIPGVELRIVDADDRPVPAGKIGRLQIRGVSITPGYHHNPEANQKSYTADGWFITGDLGVVRDDQLSITGREKDVIIINGANFYSHEIESAVEALPGVEVSFTAACAIRRPDENTDRIAVFFSPSADHLSRLPDLLKAIRTSVARKEGVSVDFILPLPKDDIPKTAIGKIQRSLLRQRFENGDFDHLLAPDSTSIALLETGWIEAPPPASAALPAGSRVLILAATDGAGARLAGIVRPGHECLVVRPGAVFARTGDGFVIAPETAADYLRLFAEAGAGGKPITHVVHAWSQPPAPEPATPADLVAAQTLGSFSLLHLLHAWPAPADETVRRRLVVVTARMQSVAPGETPDFARSPLLGLTRTIPHEYAGLDCTHLDVEGAAPDAEAQAIHRELAATGAGGEFAVRGGVRHRPVLRRIEAPAPTAPAFQTGGFYVISGGLGGIARVVARRLATAYRARLLLLGRAPLPPRADWAAAAGRDDEQAERIRFCLELEAAGADVRYAAGALTDPGFLRPAIAAAAEHWHQPPAALLHLAGAYSERALDAETPATFWPIVEPKLVGGWLLHTIAREYPGCRFVGFSSVLGHFAAAGHGAYAAANASLDRLAYRETHDGIAATSVSWSLWSGVGMGRGFDARQSMEARGYLELAPAQGCELLERALAAGRVRVLAGLDAGHRAIRRHLAPTEAGEAADATAYVAPRTEVERTVARIWQDVLGVERVGLTDNFFALGGRSLLAARVFARIEKELGASLPLSTLFQAPTVEALVRLVDRRENPAHQALPIQPQGDRTPLFCIPGAGSDPIVFQDLAQALGGDQPVYGLQAPGLDATVVAGEFPSMEEAAANFVAAIRAVQPAGPYAVAGHCFGSLLAWESARQLRQAGEEVALLALLDPIVSDVFSAEILGRDRLWYHGRKFMRMPFAAKIGYFAEKVRNFSRTVIMRRRVGRSIEQAQSMHQRYRFERYPGAVLVFLADDSFFKIAPERDPRRYYERIADGGVRYVTVPGDHHSMLHEAGAADLAAGLRTALAGAETASPGAGRTPA